MSGPVNSLLGLQHLGESGVRLRGRQNPLAAESPPNTQTFSRVRVCLCVEGHSQGSRGQGAQASAVPTFGGGLPILTPSLPGVEGVAGTEIQLREVGGQPRMRRRRWAPGRTLATAQVGSGQARDHSCHPVGTAGGERWSRTE